MLGDLKNSRAIVAKGFLFLLTGFIAAGLLLVDHPNIRTGLLLLITVWSFVGSITLRSTSFSITSIQRIIFPDSHRF